MAFKFPLETVLRLRQIAEQREERATEEILRNMAQERQNLTNLGADRERLLQQSERALRSRVSAAEILLMQGQIQAIRDREAQGRNDLAHLEEQREAQMKIYEAAHRNRELLSRMREQQMDQFKRVQARREQMQMDDIFSCRRKSVLNV